MRMAWLTGPDGSTGSLTPRLLKIRSEGAARPSGWTEKQAGRPQSVALQRRSGGAGLPVLDGNPDRDGRATGPGRSAWVKGPTGPLGTLGQANFPVRGVAPNAAFHAAVLLGNWQFGNIYRLSPTASKPLTIAKVLYQV